MDSDTDSHQEKAVGVLKELGLTEYEAKCFVALSALPKATAKTISEETDVPRTRVYDSIRVLEARGLVEVQHSSPRQFRAVSLDEAIKTLGQLYERRLETLRRSLEPMDWNRADPDDESKEVWALSDSQAIENRTRKLIDEATDEIVLVVGEDTLLTEGLLERLTSVPEEVTVLIGTMSSSTRDRIQETVPESHVFVTELDWLHAEDAMDEDTAVGRLLMVDRQAILISSWEPTTGNEHAIFGRGFTNGLVVISRRLMATGLLPSHDPQRG